jgi:3-oxosteroid 1-dehydrogenase
MARFRSLETKPERSRVMRRDFLKAGGAGALLTAASAAAISFTESAAYAKQRWDREADVIVVGSGAAGSTAAIFSQQEGANTIILEKAPIYGGTTAKSGGGYWIPNNVLMRQKGLADPREDCLRYMARASFPTLYNPRDDRLGLTQNSYELLAAYYDNASAAVDGLIALGALDRQIHWTQPGNGELMPDYYAQLPEDRAPYGRAIFQTKPDGSQGNGAVLIAKLRAAVQKQGIPILLEHRATRLVVNSKGAVVGMEVKTGDQKTVTMRARKGVIFASGGFTANPDLCLNFLRGPIFGGCTVPTGEGDFIYIGTGVGAKLANMNNAWWWPVLVEQALQSRSVPRGIGELAGESMILVNRHGRRTVNEKIQYNERTQSHFVWEPNSASFPNLIQFVIYDQFCRERFGGERMGLIAKPGISVPYVLTAQTLEELAQVIDGRLAEIAEKTGNFRLDPMFAANLKETISRFNEFAETGKDLDFNRGEAPIESAFFGLRREGNDKPNKTMYPISSQGPYYAVMLAAGTLDTKGGPMINSRAQVVDANEQPIPGLYGAGNCIGAPAAAAYWSGGATIGSAMAFGYIAAKNAAKEPIRPTT